ncbi:transcription factor IBH1-like 1 [Benincasa hispida]|uniref:transcription factor IBH1-like 1 n=1 Tax=Benincasa hispida TaxID=102211 RepID=UPI001900B46A|nr:transcription factor IBH1-like 1 [Benincasa hispida]
MPNPNKLKQQFLKKWLVGLKSTTSSNTNMNILERKKAIKMSADYAMAATRNGSTIWSRAIIAKSIKGQAPLEAISNRQTIYAKLQRKKMTTTTLWKMGRRVGRKVARSRSPPWKALARTVAKRLVEKRTKVLRSLVPGGEFMEDEVLLIEEALDYITFLQAQVDGMRFLANYCK